MVLIWPARAALASKGRRTMMGRTGELALAEEAGLEVGVAAAYDVEES